MTRFALGLLVLGVLLAGCSKAKEANDVPTNAPAGAQMEQTYAKVRSQPDTQQNTQQNSQQQRMGRGYPAGGSGGSSGGR